MGSELPTDGPFARFKSSPKLNATTASPKSEQPRSEALPSQTLGDQFFSEGRPAVATNKLNFSYPGIDGRPIPGVPPVVMEMSVQLPAGSRCILVGPNGAGKTTLLKILGGKHMVPKDSVSILGSAPFHDTELTSGGNLSYLGGNWTRDIAFAGYSIPLQGDFPVSKMVSGLSDVDPKRKQKLLEVLDIDLDWKMHLVSDGQRRRVQLLMGLLKPFEVLLLDEITVDLDVLGRADLMTYLIEETKQRKATIIYATHIFDGLEEWPTHIMYLAGGELKVFEPASAFPELREGQLLELVERWLRAEMKSKKKVKQKDGSKEDGDMAQWSNGWAAGRMTSTLKDSSNAVMRM